MQRLEVSCGVRLIYTSLGAKGLMMYKAKFAVCSDIRRKHSTQSERHVEFLNFEPGGTERNRYALKG